MTKLLLLAASAVLAAPALAQSNPMPMPSATPSGASITLDRFLARQTDRIIAADTDGDGRVSKAELASSTTRSGRDPTRMFDRMDANRDGYVDKNEMQAMFSQRFRRLDRNGDGALSADERMAGRGKPADTSAPATPKP